MERKQKLYIVVGIVAVIMAIIFLFVFLKIFKSNSKPVPTELSQDTKSFFQDIGVDSADDNKYVIIANKQFVTDSSQITLSSDPKENIFVLSSNEREPTEIRIVEQPQGANLAIGLKVVEGGSVGIPLPVPGTYRFGITSNPSTYYTLTVVEPKQ